jgi:hypothetical protein
VVKNKEMARQSMKKIFRNLMVFVLNFLFCAVAYSEPELLDQAESTEVNTTEITTKTQIKSYFIFGVSYLQWNEKMHLQSGGITDSDLANFTGRALSLEKNFPMPRWGYSLGVSLGSGLASGGGNSSKVLFQSGNQDWVSMGAFVKIYQKITPRFFIGLTAPLFWRQVKWPDPLVTSGKDLNMALLIEANFRLTNRFDFFQNIGPISSSEGATLWRLGINYRM